MVVRIKGEWKGRDCKKQVDNDEFRRGWRMRLNLAQTIVLKGNRVEYVRLGNLGSEDMREIMRKLREGEEQ